MIGVRVSIPNGMEFYSNSLLTSVRVEKVSIPNGMEFYLKLAEAQELLKRFNSQRDGILRGECGRGRNRCEVSIPNGMEFY